MEYYFACNYNIIYCKLLMLWVYVKTFFIIRFIFNDVQTLLLTANPYTFCNASGKRSQQHHINFIIYTKRQLVSKQLLFVS